MTKFDGIQSVAEMMNLMDEESRERLMKDLAQRDPEVAEAIRNKMFVFENLLGIPSKAMQTLIRETPQLKLALVLRGLSDELKAKVFSNISERARTQLEEDIDQLGPQPLSKVEEARREMIELALKLAVEGKIDLKPEE
jgi:flagellar motor switch protein FliG